jgi:hypothetical protein
MINATPADWARITEMAHFSKYAVAIFGKFWATLRMPAAIAKGYSEEEILCEFCNIFPNQIVYAEY